MGTALIPDSANRLFNTHSEPRAAVSPNALFGTLLYAGLVMSAVSTLGTPMIPTIALDQGVSIGTAQWTLTITMLTGVVLTPTLGRLSDGPHRKMIMQLTLLSVLVGSVIAALSHSFPMLLVGRMLQGAGFAIIPMGMAIARKHLPADRLRRAIAILSVTVAIGVGLGYPITGLIADHFDYHVAFWLAVGMSAVACAAVARAVPSSREEPKAGSFDFAGALLIAVGLGGITLAISQGEDWSWSSPLIIGLFLGGAAVLVLFGWIELRSPYPLLNLRLCKQRKVLAANFVAVCLGFGMYASMALVIRLAQTPTSAGYGFGTTIAVSGALMLPISILGIPANRIATSLRSSLSAGSILLIGGSIVMIGPVLLAFQHDSLWWIVIAISIVGLGLGLVFAMLPALILQSVPAHETGSATSFNQVLRTLGGAIGGAASASILTAHTAPGEFLPVESGFTVAFVIGGAVAVLGVIVGALLLGKAAFRRPAPESVAERAAERQLAEEDGDAATAGLIIADDSRDIQADDGALRVDVRQKSAAR